jgi:chromosome segregation ATPase
LEEKNSESEETAAKIEELESAIAELQSGLEAAQTEKASVEEKLTEATSTIEEMKKDKAAEVRLADLEKAGVASGKEAQMAKVREMSDEEFAAYKEERIELRNAVIAELEATPAETAEEEVEETASEEEEVETASEEEEVETVPAKVDPGQAVSAALNFETVPSTGVMAKYAEMGKAMAELMTGKKDK